MARAIAGILLLFSFSISRAQILNIEKFRTDRDTFNVWGGNIGIGFSTKKQQTSVTTLNASSNIAYFSRMHTYMNISYIKFIAVEEDRLISEGYTHFRGIIFRRRFISYEPFFQYQYDLGRGLIKRQLLGFTFRANLFSTPKFFIAANTGAMFENEIWEGEVLRYPLPGEPQTAETDFVKSTSNLSIRGDITHNVYLLFVTYYQARFEKFFTPRIISDVQLNVKISQYFTLSNQFTSTYDALPILSDNEFVYSFNTSLLVKF